MINKLKTYFNKFTKTTRATTLSLSIAIPTIWIIYLCQELTDVPILMFPITGILLWIIFTINISDIIFEQEDK